MQNKPQTQTQMNPSLPGVSLYDQDLSAWAAHNANLLRMRQFDGLDIENLIEELDDMGKSEKRGIYSHQKVLLMHLLKWQFQPAKQTPSWRYTIRNARRDLKYLIDDNLSLKSFPQTKLDSSYKDAVIMAAGETGLDEQEFPLVCPYTVDQLLDEEWLP